MDRESLQKSLVERLSRCEFHALKKELAELPVPDFAEAIEELEADQQAVLFRLLPTVAAAELFEYLPLDSQVSLIQAMGHEHAARMLDEMSSDDRTALLEELPTQVSSRLVDSLSPEEYRIALRLLAYPELSIGRLMTSEFVTVRDEMTVEAVLENIRKFGSDKETLNVLYVVDEQMRLLDDLRIREILLSSPQKTVAELRDNSFVTLTATDPQESAVSVFRKYDRTVLPVVDSHGVLLGIVTVDDVLDVAEEEATEDMQKLGGMEELDEPYMEISFFNLVKKRASWLVILFLGEMLTASAMGHYEHELEKLVLLTLFVPLIISSGGNSGSQAATLIIRAMALQEITLKDWWRVMRREIFSGLALGAILAVVGFMRIALWQKLGFTDYTAHWMLVGFTVAASLVGVVLWGTLSGSMLPFLLRKCGLDPATSSAPFVATLVDVVGLVIYFTTASMILHGTLL